MFNMLLDRLPTEYNGYLIRTSFRIGMQICMCLDDNELSEDEKILVALNLLYGKGMPEINEAMAGLNWFMSSGAPSTKEVSTRILFYWDFDAPRIFSSFKQTYGIDLTTADLHWFKFIAMIGSLDKDSAFSKAVEIRDYDMSNLKGKQKLEMQKIKRSLTPTTEFNEEEKKQLDEFNALLSGGDING